MLICFLFPYRWLQFNILAQHHLTSQHASKHWDHPHLHNRWQTCTHLSQLWCCKHRNALEWGNSFWMFLSNLSIQIRHTTALNLRIFRNLINSLWVALKIPDLLLVKKVKNRISAQWHSTRVKLSITASVLLLLFIETCPSSKNIWIHPRSMCFSVFWWHPFCFTQH